MIRLAKVFLFIVVFLFADSLGTKAVQAQAGTGQELIRDNRLTLIAENTPRNQSQSYSRIRTTIRGADGQSVLVEISVHLQSQGDGDRLLTLRKSGAPGDLVLALPETAMSPDELAEFVVLESVGSTTEMRFTTIGSLRADSEAHNRALRHGEIAEHTPAILLQTGESGELEARLRLRENGQLGRILVTLEGANSWTSLRAEAENYPVEPGASPSRLAYARTSG